MLVLREADVTGVIGGACLACGVIAALAVAGEPAAVIAVAAFGMLGMSLAWARLRGRLALWRHLRAAVTHPAWTDEDREWLRQAGAALPESQERHW